MASMRCALAFMCYSETWFASAEASPRTGFLKASKREVTLQEITNSVRLALSNQLLSSNSTLDAHSAIHSIERSLSATYQALPKTFQGGISSWHWYIWCVHTFRKRMAGTFMVWAPTCQTSP